MTQQPIQFERTLRIDESRETVWRLVSDARMLPVWAEPVEAVVSDEVGPERIGQALRCVVDLGTERGTWIQRCIGLEARESVTWRVEADSFGLNDFVSDLTLELTLIQGIGVTSARISVAYRPRNLVGLAVCALRINRRIMRYVESLLLSLADVAEAQVSLAA